MITEFLLDSVFGLVMGAFDILPDVSWSVNTSLITNALEWFKVVCYILPMGTVVVILGIIVSLQFFRIVISLIKTIWDILPIL